jgi:phosphoribosylformylglycinamidine synthase PurS subunit
MYTVRVYIYYKSGVLDPQSGAIKATLSDLGFDQIHDVETGRFYSLKIDAQDISSAQAIANELCEKLLTNPVIEDYEFEIMEA